MSANHSKQHPPTSTTVAEHPSFQAMFEILTRELGEQEAERLFEPVRDEEVDAWKALDIWAKLWHELAKRRPGAFSVPPQLLVVQPPLAHVLSFLYAHKHDLPQGGLAELHTTKLTDSSLTPDELAQLRRARRYIRRATGLGHRFRPGRFFLMTDEGSAALRGERLLGSPVLPDGRGIGGLSLAPEPRLRRTVWFEREGLMAGLEEQPDYRILAVIHEEFHAASERMVPTSHSPLILSLLEEVVVDIACISVRHHLAGRPSSKQAFARTCEEWPYVLAFDLLDEAGFALEPEPLLSQLTSLLMELARQAQEQDWHEQETAEALNRRFHRDHDVATWESLLMRRVRQ